MVRILLGRHNVNPDKADNGGRTPLMCAAWNGHEEVVTTLLGRDDANLDKPNNDDHTPPIGAASNWDGAVVKILLEQIGRAHV